MSITIICRFECDVGNLGVTKLNALRLIRRLYTIDGVLDAHFYGGGRKGSPLGAFDLLCGSVTLPQTDGAGSRINPREKSQEITRKILDFTRPKKGTVIEIDWYDEEDAVKFDIFTAKPFEPVRRKAKWPYPSTRPSTRPQASGRPEPSGTKAPSSNGFARNARRPAEISSVPCET